MNETPHPTDNEPFEKPRISMTIWGIVLVCGAIGVLLWLGMPKLSAVPSLFATSTPTVTATSIPTLTPTVTPTNTPSPTPTATPDQRVLNPANQHLYLYVRENKTWHEARTFCASQDGHLVTIQDVAENTFIFKLSPEKTWLGATDEIKEGTWIWVSGEPWEFTNWDINEPNNFNDGTEHFLEYSITGPKACTTWNDVPEGSNYFVCEWEPTTP